MHIRPVSLMLLSMLTQPVKTAEVLALLPKEGGVRELAQMLDVSTQAVYSWVEEKELPKLRGYQLQVLRPEWFKKGK